MLGRRDLIAGGCAVTALAGAGAAAQAQSAQKTFLLVHGSWAGGWVWRRVADLLENHGHKVFAPTFTGLGDRSHLLSEKVNLGTHITDVVNLIKWERLGDFILVGHSYGGNVITGVAEHVEPAIRSIVFLDAFVPENGPLPQLQMVLDAKAKGESVINPPALASFQNSEEASVWFAARFTPQPIGTYTDTLVLTGARERIRKKVYVRCTRFHLPPLDAAYAKVQSNPTWVTSELASGHHAMVDMPERVTEILLDAA